MKNKIIYLCVFSTLLLAVTPAISKNNVIGQQFPTIEGPSRVGKLLKLPQNGPNTLSLIVFGFGEESKQETKTWTSSFRNFMITHKKSSYFVVPMIGPVFFLFKPIIDMHLPKDDHFLPYYEDLAPIRKLLNMDDSSSCYVFLVDHAGIIRWAEKGSATQDKLIRLFETAKVVLS